MRFVFLAFSLFVSAAQAKPEPNTANTQMRDIAFVSRGAISLSLRLIRPAKIPGSLPVVLSFHGGAWKFGSHQKVPQVAFDLARAGVAFASVEFRSSQGARFPAQLDDARAAVRWVKEQEKGFSLDSSRIGVYGVSTGGQLAGLLAYSGSSVRAACLQSAPCDLTTLGKGSRVDWNGAKSPLAAYLGFLPTSNVQAVRRASPIFYADEDAPPTLLLAGEDDEFIASSQSEALFQTLKKAGARVEFSLFEGENHDLKGVGDEVSRLVTAFFKRELRPAKLKTS